MRLFRKKDPSKEAAKVRDPLDDEGMVGLYHRHLAEVSDAFAKATTAHLARIHEPGGHAREKREHDFMELGMKRTYLDALDDIEFTADDVVALPQTATKKRGMATLVTRWTVRGAHNRPLAGIPPTGEQITIEGATYTTFRNYNVRSEYTYWQIPELTRRMVDR